MVPPPSKVMYWSLVLGLPFHTPPTRQSPWYVADWTNLVFWGPAVLSRVFEGTKIGSS